LSVELYLEEWLDYISGSSQQSWEGSVEETGTTRRVGMSG
jgi:hypothetical protein